MIANRSRDKENNDISSEKIMSLPIRAIVFYKPKSLPHFGKLGQSNKAVTFLGVRKLCKMNGRIIYTILAFLELNFLAKE